MFLLAWFYGILAWFYGTLASLGLYQKEKEATIWLFGPDHIGKASLLLMMQRPLTLERRLEWLKLRVERLDLWLGPEERRVERRRLKQLLLTLGDEMQRLEGLEQRLARLLVEWHLQMPHMLRTKRPKPWTLERVDQLERGERIFLDEMPRPATLERRLQLERRLRLELELELARGLERLERILLAERPGLLGRRLGLHQQSQLPTSAEFSVGKIKFKVSHFGGQQIARRLLTDYNAKVDAVVYFIGINELESRHELHAILSDNSLANVPFLILGNNVHHLWMGCEDVCRDLGLNGLTTGKGKVDLAGTNVRPLEVYMRCEDDVHNLRYAFEDDVHDLRDVYEEMGLIGLITGKGNVDLAGTNVRQLAEMGYIEEGFTWLSQYIK